MGTPSTDPYTVLGLSRTVTADEIKRAYFALVRAHPPEREPETFKQIRAAYERLRDPERRAETDMLLPVAWSAGSRRRRAPSLDLVVHAEDVLVAARALTDLVRTDWRDHFKKVQV